MIVGYLYENLPLPRVLVKIILEFYGNDDINCHIEKIDLGMLNSNGTIKFDLIKINQIKLPENLIINGLANYFNYNANKFNFETPWLNIFSKYPFSNSYVEMDKLNSFNFTVGLNKLGNSEKFNFRMYDKLDCEENNLFLNFLTKFENNVFMQICKSSNPEHQYVKTFTMCPFVKPKTILDKFSTDVLISDEYYGDVIGYYYQINLTICDSITKYHYMKKLYGINKIERTSKFNISSHMGKKVKFVLTPTIKVNDELKNINISFLIKKMIAYN